MGYRISLRTAKRMAFPTVLCASVGLVAPSQSVASESGNLDSQVQILPDFTPEDSGRNICRYVGELTLEHPQTKSDWKIGKYRFETIIYSAAKVGKLDSAEDESAKVGKLWDNVLQFTKCSHINFNVINGNLIKYAIANKNDIFIYRVSRTWELGFVDKGYPEFD